MARPLRVQFKNGWHHVTARGINRQSIYCNSPDRWHFLELVGEMSQRYGLEVRGKSWAEVVRAVEAARGQKWEEFAGRHGDMGLALALYVGRRCTGLTLRALGEAARGMYYTAVSMALSVLSSGWAENRSCGGRQRACWRRNECADCEK